VFNQHIRSYSPYLEAISSLRNPRTRHAVLTVDPLNMAFKTYWQLYVPLALHFVHGLYLLLSYDYQDKQQLFSKQHVPVNSLMKT
jgi:hypothetical protein